MSTLDQGPYHWYSTQPWHRESTTKPMPFEIGPVSRNTNNGGKKAR